MLIESICEDIDPPFELARASLPYLPREDSMLTLKIKQHDSSEPVDVNVLVTGVGAIIPCEGVGGEARHQVYVTIISKCTTVEDGEGPDDDEVFH